MRILSLLALGGLISGCAVQPAREPSEAPAEVLTAEALIDAFYSFNSAKLQSAMAAAPTSIPVILYYQGWAKGGNYVVLERKPCRLEKPDEVSCAITVKDDLIAALGTGYNVTDTFHLTFKDGRIVSVRTSSNDPPEFKQALGWLADDRPELMEGPCQGFFAGGPTPQDCVREVVNGFAEWARQRR